MSIEETGCCGAYCRTCPVIKENKCRGCKLGYADRTRDLSKARCKIKVCCIQRQYNSCADCETYDECAIIQGFFNKKGYKYKKYKEALHYIRANGYEEFIAIADGWKVQYGKLK